MTRKIFVFVCLLAAVHLQGFCENTQFITAADQRISYMGRVGHSDSCASFYWTGTSATIRVKGTATVSALLQDEKDNDFYYAIVDGKGERPNRISVGAEKKNYLLASGLDNGVHVVQLFKITNTDFITLRFYGFQVAVGAEVLEPLKKPVRKIEFFGNSITCGHGVDVLPDSADSGAPQFFNNYRAYGAITARHFDAQYHCTSKSGIGITISWFPEVMPDIYDRLDPRDPQSKWDFSQYTPDIVVVNLFQNDSWLVNMPQHPQFKARFAAEKPSEAFIINAYQTFIASLRQKYPDAFIICCLGNMDATRTNSSWPGYINSAVALLKDNKISTHFFPYKNTPGHPKAKEQQAMADDLIAYIEGKGYWK